MSARALSAIGVGVCILSGAVTMEFGWIGCIMSVVGGLTVGHAINLAARVE